MVYGARAARSRLVPGGAPVTHDYLPGDGSQHWIMVHLDDVAEAYMLALEHSAGGERYCSRIRQHTVRDLAVRRRVSSPRRRGAAPKRRSERPTADDGPAMLMDQRGTAAKARRELGWVPRHLTFVAEADALHREWLTGQKAPVT
jgi:nucleoside-diphosphate-sugar epimerase